MFFLVLRFCQFYCITRLSWTRHLVLYVDYLKWLSLFFMWNIKICFMLITLFNLFPHPPPEHTIQPSKQSNKENIDGFGFRWSNPAVYTLFNINFSHISFIFLFHNSQDKYCFCGHVLGGTNVKFAVSVLILSQLIKFSPGTKKTGDRKELVRARCKTNVR